MNQEGGGTGVSPQKPVYDGMSLRQLIDEVNATSARPKPNKNQQLPSPGNYPSDKKSRYNT